MPYIICEKSTGKWIGESGQTCSDFLDMKFIDETTSANYSDAEFEKHAVSQTMIDGNYDMRKYYNEMINFKNTTNFKKGEL